MRAVEDRFWSKVTEGPDGCWLWTGAQFKKGYGNFGLIGGNVSAHRWAYEHMVAPIPAGLVLDHLCRNPPCVNPYHLDPVTYSVNISRGLAVSLRRNNNSHCHRGHEYTPENTGTKSNRHGEHRYCRTCRRNAGREWMRKHRAGKKAEA